MNIGPSDLDAELKGNWDKAADYYEILFDIAEEMIENGEVRALTDSPDMLKTITERVGD